MFRKHIKFNLWYCLVVGANVYAVVAQNQLVKMIAMPFIGISLVYYLVLKTKIEDYFQKLIFGGLILAMAGDIQMPFTAGKELYFLLAVIATLISYLLYSAAFFIDFKTVPDKPKGIGNFFFVILLASLGTFYFAAEKNLAEFKIPAILYLAALSIMVVMAGYRHKRTNQESFKLILTGSLAFLISDISIGYYFFISAEDIMMVSYLLAYLIAQYLLVVGTISRKRLTKAL